MAGPVRILHVSETPWDQAGSICSTASGEPHNLAVDFSSAPAIREPPTDARILSNSAKKAAAC